MNKIGSKVARNIIVFVVFISIAFYSFYQTRAIIKGPVVNIEYPADGGTLNIPSLNIKGSIKNASYITLNGRQIFVDENNLFNEKIILSLGYNVFEFELKDKFGRIEKKEIEVVYKM